MILQHPETLKKVRIKRTDILALAVFGKEGYKDITPERTPKQEEITRKWRNSGQLARTAVNLREVIRLESKNMDAQQRRDLNRAEIVLQQLSKKYRSEQT